MSNTKTSINSNKVNNTSTFEQWKDLTNEMATVFQSTVTMGSTVGNENAGNIILDGNIELATGHHLKADKILAAEGTSFLTVEEDVSILGDLTLNQIGSGDAVSALQYQKGTSTNTWHIKTDVDHSELIIGTSTRSFKFNDDGTITTPAGSSDSFTINNSLLGADISGVTIGANSQTTGAFTTLSATGGLTGNVSGNVTGNVTGDVKAENGTTVLDSGTNGNNATFQGDIKATNGAVVLDSGTGTNATFTGNVTGNVTGNTNGTHTGAVSGTTVSSSGGFTGNLTGNTNGTHTGAVSGTTVSASGGFTGALTGAVTGNVTGNLDGIVGGNTPAAITGTTITANTGFSGPLTGDVIGSVSGNAGGNAGSASLVHVSENNTNQLQRIPFFSDSDGDGNKALRHNDQLRYNPNLDRLSCGAFYGNVVGDVAGNASSASKAAKWTTPRTLGFTSGSDLEGSWSVDGTGDVLSNITVKDGVVKTTVANITDMDTFVGSLIDLDDIYPVGSIYISTVNTNPNTLFGGTWEAFGQGRCLVGVGAGFSNGQTGGAYTHKLTTAQLPSHSHQHNTYSGRSFSKSGSLATNGVTQGSNGVRLDTYTESTTSVGSNNSFNITQPYVAVYMWKRVP